MIASPMVAVQLTPRGSGSTTMTTTSTPRTQNPKAANKKSNLAPASSNPPPSIISAQHLLQNYPLLTKILSTQLTAQAPILTLPTTSSLPKSPSQKLRTRLFHQRHPRLVTLAASTTAPLNPALHCAAMGLPSSSRRTRLRHGFRRGKARPSLPLRRRLMVGGS